MPSLPCSDFWQRSFSKYYKLNWLDHDHDDATDNNNYHHNYRSSISHNPFENSLLTSSFMVKYSLLFIIIIPILLCFVVLLIPLQLDSKQKNEGTMNPILYICCQETYTMFTYPVLLSIFDISLPTIVINPKIKFFYLPLFVFSFTLMVYIIFSPFNTSLANAIYDADSNASNKTSLTDFGRTFGNSSVVLIISIFYSIQCILMNKKRNSSINPSNLFAKRLKIARVATIDYTYDNELNTTAINKNKNKKNNFDMSQNQEKIETSLQDNQIDSKRNKLNNQNNNNITNRNEMTPFDKDNDRNLLIPRMPSPKSVPNATTNAKNLFQTLKMPFLNIGNNANNHNIRNSNESSLQSFTSHTVESSDFESEWFIEWINHIMRQCLLSFILTLGITATYYFCQYLTWQWEDSQTTSDSSDDSDNLSSLNTFDSILLFYPTFWFVMNLMRFVLKRIARFIDSNKFSAISMEVCIEFFLSCFYVKFFVRSFLLCSFVYLLLFVFYICLFDFLFFILF